MDTNLVQKLISAREDVKHKIRTLKGDIEKTQSRAEAQFAPLKEPLRDISKKLEAVNLLTFAKKPSVSKHELITPKKDYFPNISSLISELKKVPTVSETSAVGETPLVKPKFKRRLTSTPKKPTTIETSPGAQFLRDEDIFQGQGGEDEWKFDDSSTESLGAYEVDAREKLGDIKKRMDVILEQTLVREALERLDPLPRTYVAGLTTDVEEDFDQQYGVRATTEGLYIGNSPVQFDGKNILVGKFTYEGSIGLYELLFKKEPGKFTLQDMRNYKDILQRSHAHTKDYGPSESMVTDDENKKFVNIIKPIVEGKRPNVHWARYWPKPKHQGGILNKLLIPGAIKEYEYWDDVNELVDRLRLLIASQAAGHTGHQNEIISIIEELKEANVIQ